MAPMPMQNPDTPTVPTPDAPTVPTPTVTPARPLWFSAALVACVLLTVIGLSAFGGYRAGLARRDQQAREAARQAADQQFTLGLQDLAVGRYELARQRFEFVLNLDPDYPGAAARLAETLRLLNATATPTASPTPSSNPAGEYFQQAREHYQAGDWEGVIEMLTTLHGLDPAYEAIKADGMMYMALRNLGMEHIEAGALEPGIYDLDQAEQIGPLDGEASAYRLWSELYLTADSFWGLNWERAAYFFGQLYAAAPYFQDTFQKYHQATRNYADQLSRAGDACGAEQQYAEALRLLEDSDVADLQATARATCLLGTPTPDPNATPGPDDLALTPAPGETPTAVP